LKYVITGVVLGVVLVISVVAFVHSRKNNKILIDMRRASVDFGSRISSLANNGNQTIHKEIAESEIPEDFLGSDNFEVSARDPNKSSNNQTNHEEFNNKENVFGFA
jgi:hypothetical protein